MHPSRLHDNDLTIWKKIKTKLKQIHKILIYYLFFGFVLVEYWELLLLLTDNSTI